MSTFIPINIEQLLEFIQEGHSKLRQSEKHFCDVIRVAPKKWKLSPWGDMGGGFWVVGIVGKKVLWYNDIEDGFNISSYSKYGEIGVYEAEQDEFEWTVRLLKSFVESGNLNRKIGLRIPDT